MIRLRLNEILEEMGITNKTQIAKKIGLSRWSFIRMLYHPVTALELVTIEKICKELGITPNDLIVIDDGPIGIPTEEEMKKSALEEPKDVEGKHSDI